MAARTNVPDVIELTGTTLPNGTVNLYVQIADEIVTDQLTDEGLTDSKLERITLLLAAHLVTANRERQAVSESVDPASITYSDIFSRGLESTTYGQTLLALDTSGILGQMDKKTIKVKVVKEEHEFRYTNRTNR